jgi:hypothetical protein
MLYYILYSSTEPVLIDVQGTSVPHVPASPSLHKKDTESTASKGHGPSSPVKTGTALRSFPVIQLDKDICEFPGNFYDDIGMPQSKREFARISADINEIKQISLYSVYTHHRRCIFLLRFDK